MSSPPEKAARYGKILRRLDALLAGETDGIAIMATIVCELHHGFDHFHWTGFYRLTEPGMLRVGPYQGGHGCLAISLDRGVCGKCATDGETQIVEDVNAIPWHIACSGTTRSEIVVPVKNRTGQVVAVLDVDSDLPSAFDVTDARFLETICAFLIA
jgi:GAF domain-containing protein